MLDIYRRVRLAIKDLLHKIKATDERARSDGEQAYRYERQIARNRFWLTAVCTVYIGISNPPIYEQASLAIYVVTALGIFLSQRTRRRFSEVRRQIAMAADAFIVSVSLHLRPEVYVLGFPVYLWFISGNGYRFGIGALLEATLVSSVMFSIVVLITPFWKEHLYLSFGLLFTLSVPNAYTSVLIWRLFQDRLSAEQDRLSAEKANSAKTMFLAAISHELRTPLNAILGSVSLIDSRELSLDNRENFAAVDLGARTLLNLIGSILDYSRIEANRAVIRNESFNIADLVAEVKELVYVEARAKGISVSAHIAMTVNPYIKTDRGHLSEILLNLVSNAVKFTEHGSVLILVDIVRTRAGASMLHFDVIDTGIGIDPIACAHIFDSFAQADRSILDRYGGTGLGLAISKKLAGFLNGDIGVKSEQGVGSSFWFEIGYIPSERGWGAEAATTTQVSIISDDLQATKMLQESLTELRINGSVVPDLQSAFDDAKKADLRSHRRAIIWYVADATTELKPSYDSLKDLDPDGRMPRLLICPHLRATKADLQSVDTILRSCNPTEVGRALHLTTRRLGSISLESGPLTVPQQPSGQSFNILIVDDNLTNRQVLEKIFRRSGHTTVSVTDGEQAVVEMLTGAYDIVLMDVNMPVMNGLDATKAFRSQEATSTRLPILALTADATPDTNAACQAAGMDGCITKPIVPSQLLKHIASTHAAVVSSAQPTSLDNSSVRS